MPDATRVLLIPGWHGSPDGHWQTIWERGGWRHARRIQQRDWVAAERADWVRGVEEAVTGPVLLVAHSLGVLTVAHWAAESGKTGCVAGAFLVAPPDPESMATFPAELASFANVPMGRLWAGLCDVCPPIHIRLKWEAVWFRFAICLRVTLPWPICSVQCGSMGMCSAWNLPR